MILNPEVITILILDFLFLFFGMIAFILSINIAFRWDIDSTSPVQYKLEKQSFLAATIIKYIFAVKIPLFLFFIFMLDKTSNIITGAMCAAGVVNATIYGSKLFILKIINLYLFGFWLVLNSVDMQSENMAKTKVKFKLFIFMFLLLITEIIMELLMFNAIDLDKIVSCCGTLYSSSTDSYLSKIFLIDKAILVSAFYINFIAIAGFYLWKQRYLFMLANAFFIIISIVTLITFFGPYIYELPTHNCPFCFLQKDYYYVGYLIYLFLFIGTFPGFIIGFIEQSKRAMQRYYDISMIFITLYVILVSAYPIAYYIKNGVWL